MNQTRKNIQNAYVVDIVASQLTCWTANLTPGWNIVMLLDNTKIHLVEDDILVYY